MKLGDYILGYADATKEYLLEPVIFESAFFDSKHILEKIEETWKYILIGRKGVGKTAYIAKLQSLSNDNNQFFTSLIPLNDFEYSTFAKTSSDNDITGTKKYLESWQFILLLSIYKFLNTLNMIENKSFQEMIVILNKFEFSINEDLRKNVTKVSKLKLGASVGNFDANYEAEFGTKPFSFSERITTLIEKMKASLKDIYLNKRVFLLIDGVDDILRFKKNQLEILSSLIRSIDTLNEYFYRNEIKVKIILSIREDILSNITDPDFNKIKRDGAINLSWAENTQDLKEIVELRLKMSDKDNSNCDMWYKIFPRQIRNTDSWKYLLDHTLYKPRDVLQFLVTCQELFPNKEKLTYADMLRAIKSYSRDYFIEEMKNELSGFSYDLLINSLPSILQKIGRRAFYLGEFIRITNEQSTLKKYSEQDIKYLLLMLFQSGYIGQLINSNYGRESVVFKYRNPNLNIDYSQKFISHQGLHKGLGVIS